MIEDPRGQWAHPGKNTRIPGNQITMEGVDYPVWAVPDVGEPVLMQPGQNYTFPGASYVDEYPMLEQGGELPKAQIGINGTLEPITLDNNPTDNMDPSGSGMNMDIEGIRNNLSPFIRDYVPYKDLQNAYFWERNQEDNKEDLTYGNPNSVSKGGQLPTAKEGGEYETKELTDAEIKEYVKGGYIVEEELPKAKRGLAKLAKYFKPKPIPIPKPSVTPTIRYNPKDMNYHDVHNSLRRAQNKNKLKFAVLKEKGYDGLFPSTYAKRRDGINEIESLINERTSLDENFKITHDNLTDDYVKKINERNRIRDRKEAVERMEMNKIVDSNPSPDQLEFIKKYPSYSTWLYKNDKGDLIGDYKNAFDSNIVDDAIEQQSTFVRGVKNAPNEEVAKQWLTTLGDVKAENRQLLNLGDAVYGSNATGLMESFGRGNDVGGNFGGLLKLDLGLDGLPPIEKIEGFEKAVRQASDMVSIPGYPNISIKDVAALNKHEELRNLGIKAIDSMYTPHSSERGVIDDAIIKIDKLIDLSNIGTTKPLGSGGMWGYINGEAIKADEELFHHVNNIPNLHTAWASKEAKDEWMIKWRKIHMKLSTIHDDLYNQMINAKGKLDEASIYKDHNKEEIAILTENLLEMQKELKGKLQKTILQTGVGIATGITGVGLYNAINNWEAIERRKNRERRKLKLVNNKPPTKNTNSPLPKNMLGGELSQDQNSIEGTFVNSKEHGVDTPVYIQVEEKESPIHGTGVFSKEPISKGQSIGVSHIRKEFEKNGEMYQAAFPSKQIGGYNHSEEPNVTEVDNGDHISLIAIRDIQPGEELLSNYDDSDIQDTERSSDFTRKDVPKAQDGHSVKQRRGVRDNYDYKAWTPSGLQFPTSVSSHLMAAEYVDGRGWIAFPTLFQDSKPYADDQENWKEVSGENGWWPIYQEALKRGEVYDFGEDKEAALAFGRGSWKDQLPEHLQDKQKGGFQLELTPEEIDKYVKGGYVVEELPKALDGGVIKKLASTNKYFKKILTGDEIEKIKGVYSYLNENNANVINRLPQLREANDLIKLWASDKNQIALKKGTGMIYPDLELANDKSKIFFTPYRDKPSRQYMDLEFDSEKLLKRLQEQQELIKLGESHLNNYHKIGNDYPITRIPIETNYGKDFTFRTNKQGFVESPLPHFYHGVAHPSSNFNLENLEFDRNKIDKDKLKGWTDTGRKHIREAGDGEYGLFGSMNLNTWRDPALKYSSRDRAIFDFIKDPSKRPDDFGIIKKIDLSPNAKFVSVNTPYVKEALKDINYPNSYRDRLQVSGRNKGMTPQKAATLKSKWDIDGIIDTEWGELAVFNPDAITGVSDTEFKLFDYTDPITGLLDQNLHVASKINNKLINNHSANFITPHRNMLSSIKNRYDAIPNYYNFGLDSEKVYIPQSLLSNKVVNMPLPSLYGPTLQPFSKEWWEAAKPNIDLIRKQGGELPKAKLGLISLAKPLITGAGSSNKIIQGLSRGIIDKGIDVSAILAPETMKKYAKHAMGLSSGKGSYNINEFLKDLDSKKKLLETYSGKQLEFAGPRDRSLVDLYFGDDSKFKESRWLSELESKDALKKYTDHHGPLKSYELLSNFANKEPLSGFDVLSTTEIANPKIDKGVKNKSKYDAPHVSIGNYDGPGFRVGHNAYKDFNLWKDKLLAETGKSKNPDRLIKAYNQIFDRFGDVIPFEVDSKSGYIPNFKFLGNPVKPIDDIAGHMAFLRRNSSNSFDLTTRDIWGFHPVDYTEKWGNDIIDPYFKNLAPRLVNKFGKPFILTQTNPLHFDLKKGGQLPKAQVGTISKALKKTLPFATKFDDIVVNSHPFFKTNVLKDPLLQQEMLKHLATGIEPIQNYVGDMLYELKSPEGKKRLLKQESEHLEHIGYPKNFIDKQAELNYKARLQELELMGNVRNSASVASKFLDQNRLPEKDFFNSKYLYSNASYTNPNNIYLDAWAGDINNYDFFNLNKTQLGEKALPGFIRMGVDYSSPFNTPILAHEIRGHGLQRGRKLQIDRDALKMIRPKKELNENQQKAYDYFKKSGKEPSAYLNELREAMLLKGLIKHRYENITPEKLQVASTFFKKNPMGVVKSNNSKSYLSNTRILDFMEESPEMYQNLSWLFNRLPTVGLGLGAAGAAGSTLEEKKLGGDLPKAQKFNSIIAPVSHEDSISHQADKVIKYEQLMGSKEGNPLPFYSNPKYKQMFMDIASNLTGYNSAMEKSEAADFIFNSGSNPKRQAIQEFYRKNNPELIKTDKYGRESWPERNSMSDADIDKLYKTTVGSLKENDRRVLNNLGRDWYYKNSAPKGVSYDYGFDANGKMVKGENDEWSPAYQNTWYGRIHNTNTYNEFDPDDKTFIHPSKRQRGGELPKAWDGRIIKQGSKILSKYIKPVDTYNKIVTGNSVLPYALKLENSIIPKSTDYIKKLYTDKQIELLDKYGRGMQNLSPEDWESLVEFTKSGATDFSKGNFPISRMMGYYDISKKAEENAIKNLKLFETFTFPKEKNIRTWSAGIPTSEFERTGVDTRLVIPSKYTKKLGDHFAGMPYTDKRSSFIWRDKPPQFNYYIDKYGRKVDMSFNKNAIKEKELIGGLPNNSFTLIGKTKTNGINNLIIKPNFKQGGDLPKAKYGKWMKYLNPPNSITTSKKFLFTPPEELLRTEAAWNMMRNNNYYSLGNGPAKVAGLRDFKKQLNSRYDHAKFLNKYKQFDKAIDRVTYDKRLSESAKEAKIDELVKAQMEVEKKLYNIQDEYSKFRLDYSGLPITQARGKHGDQLAGGQGRIYNNLLNDKEYIKFGKFFGDENDMQNLINAGKKFNSSYAEAAFPTEAFRVGKDNLQNSKRFVQFMPKLDYSSDLSVDSDVIYNTVKELNDLGVGLDYMGLDNIGSVGDKLGLVDLSYIGKPGERNRFFNINPDVFLPDVTNNKLGSKELVREIREMLVPGTGVKDKNMEKWGDGRWKEGGSVELGDVVDEATMERLKAQGYTFEEI